MPESAFVVRNRDQIPPVGRTTTALQIWRDTATGQAAVAAARGGRMIRGRGRGRASGRGKGLGRKKGAKWLLFGSGDAGNSDQPLAQVPLNIEEYQSVEVNTTQNAPGDLSD